MIRSWFAIHTKPNREISTRLQYEQQGYVVYLPLLRRVIHHARRRQEVFRPFFPGYLFLHLAPSEQNWIAISSTHGAIGPICFGEQHAPPVPDWVIQDIKAREEEGAITLGALQKDLLKPGAAVGIQLDSETISPGLVYSLRGKDNVVVLIQLMGREVKATVPIQRICLA